MRESDKGKNVTGSYDEWQAAVDSTRRMAQHESFHGGMVMRVSDTGKPITLAEIEAQRQGIDLSDETIVKSTQEAWKNLKPITLAEIEEQRQGLPFDQSGLSDALMYARAVIRETSCASKARAMYRAKLMDELHEARCNVKRISRNIINFDKGV